VSETYARKWNRARRAAQGELDVEQARARHQAGQPYTAVLHADDGTPRAWIDVDLSLPFVGVHFLDDLGREHTAYLFGPLSGTSQLFLEEVHDRAYVGDEREPVRGRTTVFRPGERVKVSETDRAAGTRDSYELEPYEGLFDALREERSAFGDYERLAALDRPTARQG
jgi:hypothetical protein